MCLKQKNTNPAKGLPYNQRILNYNFEKQSALQLASNAEEADRIIRYLRKKWGI